MSRTLNERTADASALLALTDVQDWREIAESASTRRDHAWGGATTFSRKVFIPLTQLCRDVCHYCTFAKPPRQLASPYMDLQQVLRIAEAGAEAGCHEALFTTGDRPEARYEAARSHLRQLGHDSTASYVAEAAALVRDKTGLLPHINIGILSSDEYRLLRPHAPSFGLMLETAAERLSLRGGPHHGSPDKLPATRLAAIERAGELRIPLTTGLLIGIGETRAERIEALLAIRDLSERHGHIQEVIVQNFRAKPGTQMQGADEPSADELCWTIAVARLILGDEISLQAPPNLYGGDLTDLIRAGINDWGGISPVTPDHVNPEARWPEIDRLADITARGGKTLTERLTVYPRYIAGREEWIDPGLHRDVLVLSDTGGLARQESWTVGSGLPIPTTPSNSVSTTAMPAIVDIVDKCLARQPVGEAEIVRLFQARGADFIHIAQEADRLRQAVSGRVVRYVVNRNINYTNICLYHCSFCAFSKGQRKRQGGDPAYLIDLAEIGRRTREAWERGATEVCLQGGIHPDYTGNTYLEICAAVKAECPDMHVHAFSPLEVAHGAQTLGRSIPDFLRDLKAAGLGSLPGTAAEILCDDVRAIICPDKLNTAEWLDVLRSAHQIGLRSTATIMFGHVEEYAHWARHLLELAALQRETGGITEFVPLPFVHQEAPMFARSGARMGATIREAVLMHAVARLVFHGLIDNIQTSWVKLGADGARMCLNAGANDLGGTLMNESISRAAGAVHGQEMSPQAMTSLIEGIGRQSRPRTTLYASVSNERTMAAWQAGPLTPVRTGMMSPAKTAELTA